MRFISAIFCLLNLQLFLYGAAPDNSGNAPELIEAFPVPALPELSPTDLVGETEIHTFRASEGIVLYRAKGDRWQLFSHLSGHASKGNIVSITRGGNSIWVTLKSGMVRILTDSKTIDIPFATNIIGVTPEFAYFVVFNNHSGDESFDREYYDGSGDAPSGKFSLKRFDFKSNKAIDITAIDTQDWGGLLSWCFYEKRFWLAFAHKAISVDIYGKTLELSEIDGFPQRVTHFESIGKNLYSFADGAYKVSFNSDSKPIIQHSHIGNRYPGFDSTALAGKSLYIRPSKSPWANTITKFSVDSKKEQRIKLPIPVNPDGLNYFHSALWVFSQKYQMVFKWEPEKNAIAYFPIREGNLGPITAFTEDNSEIWALSDTNGIFIYDKNTERWNLLPLAWEIPDYTSIRQITLNKEYAFLAQTDNYGIPKNFLLIDRKTHEISTLSGEQIIKRFLSPYADAASPMSAWRALLFFLRLPLTGIDTDYTRTIIQGKEFSLSSVFSQSGNRIYKIDNATDKLEVFTLPGYIKYFGSSIVPHNIAGDAQTIWAGGRGHSSQGIYKYSLLTNKLVQNATWYDQLQDCWGLGENEDKVFIGINYQNKYLGVLDKANDELTLYGKEVGFTGTPYTIASNAKYDLFATDNGVVYYDRSQNRWGKILKTWTRLHPSDRGIYLEVSGKKYYRVQDPK